MRQPYAGKQIRKPRVRTQPVKERIQVQKKQPYAAFLVRFFQPGKRLLAPVEGHVDAGQMEWLDVLLLVETE